LRIGHWQINAEISHARHQTGGHASAQKPADIPVCAAVTGIARGHLLFRNLLPAIALSSRGQISTLMRVPCSKDRREAADWTITRLMHGNMIREMLA